MKRKRRREKEGSEKKNWKKGRKKKETPSGIEAKTLCVLVEASSYNY